ncbi:MAG TPA: trypsin-like peptidase domain-containing protein, partial [Promicromonospora sp.]|nr:trypsin-like peptidase domain-containing protein [Promicromonospora sp.]
PAQHAPGQHAPGQQNENPVPASVPVGTASAPGNGSGYTNPYAVPATTADAAPKSPRNRTWVPVVSAAAAAALLASLGTAGVIAVTDDDSAASLADVGQTNNRSVPVNSSSVENPNWPEVTAAVQESVVAIQVAGQRGGAEGSGVVLDAEGHVLTNNHVVSGAQTVKVTLSDGRVYDADIVGTDPTTDLAVVQLQDPPSDLSPATFADSDDVAVGEPVLALGNPLGLANTATTGIVSALDRPVTASAEDGSDQVVTNAIQIDAAVNPGNSGGPLFNASGEVIGITSSIATLSGSSNSSGSIGLGFAIPSNLASQIGDQLREDGSVEHAFLGVTLSDAEATADGVTRRGAGVQEVVPDSPAGEADVRRGDVIVAIDGEPVNGSASLTAFVREKAAGDKAVLTVVRDGRTQEVTVTLAVREESSTPQGQDPSQGSGQGSGQGSRGGSDQSSPNNIPDWLQQFFDQR